jgi:hypothetical protein
MPCAITDIKIMLNEETGKYVMGFDPNSDFVADREDIEKIFYDDRKIRKVLLDLIEGFNENSVTPEIQVKPKKI